MEIEKIFFDMDGVLADFQGGLQKFCGLEPVVQGKSNKEKDDMMFAAVKEVEHFYRFLDPLPGAVELFHAVYDKYGDKCEILTGVPKPWRGIVNAKEDKTEWAHQLLSPEVVVHTPLRAEKILYCKGPNSILIDDFVLNIQEWEKAGGTGILHRNAESTLRRLKDLGVL